MSLEEIKELSRRVERLEKRLTAKRSREMTLREKFFIHDRAQVLLRQFDEISRFIPDDLSFTYQLLTSHGPTMSVKEHLGEIMKNLMNLIDQALGAIR